MKQIISVVLFLIGVNSCFGAELDSLLLIKKRELAWLLEVVADREVLKKRVELKDTTIASITKRIAFLQDEIKVCATLDSISEVQKKVLSQKAINSEKKVEIYKNVTRKVQNQNTLLKIGIVALSILFTLILI